MNNKFTQAFKYRSRFKSHNGFDVEFESVCIAVPGYTPQGLVDKWNGANTDRYKVLEIITVQEAIDTPALPDRMSMQGYIDLVGDESDYIVMDCKLTYL